MKIKVKSEMAILEESPNGEETGERMILRNMIH